MKTEPWLSIIGVGEDGLNGLCNASRTALDAAEIIFGGERHLQLIAAGERGHAWPTPFDLAPLLMHRGRCVVVLASGDPFWHGVGSSIARRLSKDEWQVYPHTGCLSLAAAQLGWPLDETTTMGLHAAPFEQLLPYLCRDCRILCTLRDGEAAHRLAQWLCARDFGAAQLTVLEALGGERERVRNTMATDFALHDVQAPVVVAIDGNRLARGCGLPRSSGLPDDAFAHDGQITKRAVRALTLSALAPRPGEHLWDLGAGSASIAVEWCLAGGTANAVEQRADRIANIDTNITAFGLHARLTGYTGQHLSCLDQLPTPDAVFVGGGTSAALIDALWRCMPPHCRLVINAVTLETEALLIDQHARLGGSLVRIDLASVDKLGTHRGWQTTRPIVQWSVVR